MVRQNENRLLELWAKPSWRREGPAALVDRTATSSPKRGVCVPEKGPTFLNVYVIPVLLLSLAVVGWTFVTRHIVLGLMVYLGYALIIAVGLRLYLACLDHYLLNASSVQSERRVQPSTRDQDHHHESELWRDAHREDSDACRISAKPGPKRCQPRQI
jgi:hypothetical protein